MKASFATTALCLAIYIMALVPTADGKLTGVRENGPSELAEVDKEERVLCPGRRKLKAEMKGGKKGGKKAGKKGGNGSWVPTPKL
jgi:hypothetical protein